MGRAPLIFLIAFVGTLLGSMIGGSSSLLSTPSWIAMGFPLPVAVVAIRPQLGLHTGPPRLGRLPVAILDRGAEMLAGRDSFGLSSRLPLPPGLTLVIGY